MNQRDIAKIAGVSSATISRVINNDPLVKESTKEYIKEIIKKHGYVPNAAARTLKTANTHIIGYLVPDINNPFFTAVLSGFEDLCFRKGYDIIFQNTNENPVKEQMALQTLLKYRVDGLLAVFVDSDNQSIEQFKKMNIPIVCIDRKSHKYIYNDCILIDNFDGMEKIVKYLVSMGHRKIAMIQGTVGITPGEERNSGFEKAMHKFGIEILPDYRQQGYFTETGAYKATQRLISLRDRPTAIISPNNLSTMGAYCALRDNGIEIGKDISLIGFDDFPLASHLTPPITVLKRPNTKIGKIAAEMLIKRIESDNKYGNEKSEELRLSTELCIRESCARM